MKYNKNMMKSVCKIETIFLSPRHRRIDPTAIKVVGGSLAKKIARCGDKHHSCSWRLINNNIKNPYHTLPNK